MNATKIDQTQPIVYDYDTDEPIRNATAEELQASRDAADSDSGRGVIEIDGRDCYVQD
jgi:hypothetical protein